MSWQGTELDHIVIVAPTLTEGAAWVRTVLGVEPQPGGQHDRMATHNLLLGLGARTYLEIIAIDASVPAPARPRWFGMDERSADAPAGLATWVARTDDLEAAVAACPQSPGEILPMTRASLEWRITVPADGRLLCGGLAPTLIQWRSPKHPAASLRDSGVRLASLTLVHPDAALCRAWLGALRFQGPVTVEQAAAAAPPHLIAHFDTPSGRRSIGSLPPRNSPPRNSPQL